MRKLDHYVIIFLAAALAGCSSAPNSYVPAWRQIQPGMAKKQAYDILGKPLRETEQEAVWKSPEAKMGWPATTYWRTLEVYFDDKGQVKGTRDYNEQK